MPELIPTDHFFDRDLSWLSFNQRVLDEAGRDSVPLLERLKFLGIYSSNLDEFYRVRMPVLQALRKLDKKSKISTPQHTGAVQANEVVHGQQQQFGAILTGQLIPALRQHNINLIFNEAIPTEIEQDLSAYFYTQVLAFLQPMPLFSAKFYPENNKLYLLILLQNKKGNEEVMVINIPSDKLPRFFCSDAGGSQYIVFLDDIIRNYITQLFPGLSLKDCYSFKVTREAELDLKGEYEGDLAEQIEKQLSKRDFGHATRFLYQPGIPLRILESIINNFNLPNSSLIEGGRYHNLKDLLLFPVKNSGLLNEPWQPVVHTGLITGSSIFEQLDKGDIMIHPPYHSYDTVLRFFNEAATNDKVKEIYISLYRVASDSRIVNALISAAENGKEVVVLVELKARFDEENNLKWAKKLKRAGATIIYSSVALKVHAKIALVKLKYNDRMHYYGLLGTGNFNEGTAKLYTDHILATANRDLLREVEIIFLFLVTKDKPEKHPDIHFDHLLVSKFNLHQRFIKLIDREISFAKKGQEASITIKLNNLEERRLITKLYEASRAGVKINLLIRGICCLIPGVEGMSDNISLKRIVDRYLEHGRIFIFNNNGNNEVYLGSADWMDRNIYRRIEVCFPVLDPNIREQVKELVQLQLADNVQAVTISNTFENVPIHADGEAVQSQKKIYDLLNN